MARLLVIDDDAVIRKIVRDRFRAAGHEVGEAESGEQGLALAESFEPDLVIVDLMMPGMDGIAVVQALGARAEPPEAVVITAHGSIEIAVKACRAGAADFVSKPFEAAHLEHVVGRVLEGARLRRRVETLETEVSGRHALVAGGSAAMAAAVSTATRAAASEATVLLLGETGTGKEVLARHIHRSSRRAGGPFVAVNCATLSPELIESDLFGHEKGAFTGAVRARPGKIEVAAGGSLLLDEIADLAAPLQAKLLRVLQEREFERVGGTRPIRTDLRLLAATHQDLASTVAAGRFREDLYYRLAVVSIRVPPLRERPEDVPALLDHFLARHSHDAGRRGLRFVEAARGRLLAWTWPGNVRELSNVVERCVVLSAGETIGIDDLPEEIREAAAPSSPPPAAPPPTADGAGLAYHEAVAESKRAIIRDALRRTGGHQTRAARLLGLTQPYLARLIKSLGVSTKE